jgi:hypothetical protein
MSKVEAFWQDATADDVARVMAGETVEARFRDDEKSAWFISGLAGWTAGIIQWYSTDGDYWNHCQVYREPSWWTNKPDPGPGYRLLEKLPDEEPQLGDSVFCPDSEIWLELEAGFDPGQLPTHWYRRRIEQLLSGHRWLANGDRLESGDLYYEKGALLEVGHEYWGNKVVLAEAFMRKIEQPGPEPKHYVLRVGDSVETPSGHKIKAVSPGLEQIEFKLRAGFKATLPNGQTITATEKGFEVAQ